MSTEQRQSVRQRVSRVEVKVASQEAFRASYLRDLSTGGLFVRSRQPLPEGTSVIIELAVESRPPVRLRGEVVRQEHGPDGTARGFGVRFSTVDEETRQSLESIILEHQQPGAPAEEPLESLETQLAEARGTAEAYEQTLASLREREEGLVQRLETAEAEREVLANVAHELQGQVQALEAEGATLRANVARLMERLERGEAETKAQQERTARLAAELKAARTVVAQTASASEDAVSRLARELEAQTAQAAALQAGFGAEVAALKAQLEERDDSTLRAELQDVSTRLDDERLKSMALERALQRFVEMGGVIPPRPK